MDTKPAVWLPTVRANSGTDVFSVRLRQALDALGIRAEITWLSLRAEFAPWTIAIPKPPPWANIVHINTWLHGRFIPTSLPAVATLHSCVHDSALEPYKTRTQALYHRHWIRRLESANLRRATAVTAVSRYTATIAAQVFGRDDIAVIPNGVDTRVFSPRERRAPQNPFRLLYVGNWSSGKGVDLLGPIMRQLGDGFELLYTDDRAGRHKHYSLPPHCRTVGRPSGPLVMAHYYRDADALLFPSRLEGFGLVAAEAMACGLPVVAADNTALPELVRHDVTGILCPTDEITCMVNAIRSLRKNPERWRAMRAQASRWTATEFSEERQIERYLTLYENVLSGTVALYSNLGHGSPH